MEKAILFSMRKNDCITHKFFKS